MIPSSSVCCFSCVPASVSFIAFKFALREIEKSRGKLPPPKLVDSKATAHVTDVCFDDGVGRCSPEVPLALPEPQPEPQSALTPSTSLNDLGQVVNESDFSLVSEKELERLREKVSQLQDDLAIATVAARAKRNECEALANNLHDVEAQRDDAIDAARRASERALELSQKNAEFVGTIGDLTKKEEELSSQMAKFANMEDKLRIKNAVIIQKDNELVALQRKATSTERELNATREVSARFEEKSRRLGGDLIHLKDSMSKMRDVDHQKDLQLNEKSYEVSTTCLEIARKDDELRKKMAEIMLKENELAALRSKLAGAEREHEQRVQVERRLEELTRHNEHLCEQLKEMGRSNEMDAHRQRPMSVGWESLEHRIDELHAEFAEAQRALRQKSVNDNIRVYVRVRPIAEREAGGEVVVRKIDTFQLEVAKIGLQRYTKNFNVDSIFDQNATQEDVFAECRNLVSSAIDGYNVTVFAYGQTGAGKTHTMYGSQSAPGLVPRFAQELFATLSACAHDYETTVRCSMFELYCDDLFDLLLPARREQVRLEIKKDAGGSVHVSGATEKVVASQEELLKVIQSGQEKRHVASTKMNADSSRSHLIFTIVVDCISKKTKVLTSGKLTLCDLAGSERLKKSQATGDALKEAQFTNKSLSALVDVIEASSNNAPHIPYRNHKLTQLLSDSIGGKAKTLMLVNCSPVRENADETASSLKYAARAKLVVNEIERNQVVMELAALKRVILELKQLKKHGSPKRALTPAVPMQCNTDFQLRVVPENMSC